MPPIPMIGIFTFLATCQTMRSAIGLIAGPLRPPVPLPRTKRFFFQSIARPMKVLTRETASAPASAAAWAMTETSVTLGVSFAMMGRLQNSLTPLITLAVFSGSIAKSTPPETFGHERFSSNAASPVSLLIL